MAMKDNYQLLIEKLDEFTRKYYINQLIRGSLYSVALILALFILMNFLEYNFYYGTAGRKLLFYSFIGISLAALGFWVFAPLLRYFRLGKVIANEQAAAIIGEHFTDVKDKLLNILQLKKQADTSQNAALLIAGINQKTEEIKPVPFRSAINLNNNKKYLRYTLPPLLLLLILLFAAPSIITDSTDRLIHNNKEFERAAPFHFFVENQDLSVVQFSDYSLKVKIEGEVLPQEVFIDIDNYHYRLTKEEANIFSYTFSNVQKDTEFKIFSSGINSEDYKLTVLKKPNILGFDINLDYPAYTKRKDEKISNIGDLVVPMGTNLDWVFNAENTDDIAIRFSGKQELIPAERFDNELFTFKKQMLRDEGYKILVSNKNLPNADSVAYSITVIPDLQPTISVEKFVDSTDSKLLFFIGDASDDYGLLSLSFNYRLQASKGPQAELKTIKMKKPAGRQIQYDYTWDIRNLELKPGDEISYYFEVYDNDAVNGNKNARTNIMTYKKPTVEEFEELEEKNNDEIKKDLKDSVEESKKIKEDFKKLREKLLQEKEMDWQSRKELEKLMERQKELEKKIDEAKKNFEENMKNQSEFSEPNEELQKKQEKVQELMEDLMSDEMKDLMQQIEDLMQELEKDNALEMMEEMEMNDEELEMELDRMLELLKQLEVEKDMQDQLEKLEELAKEQEELAEETEKQEDKPEDQQSAEEKQKQEELEKKQEELNKEFEKIQEKQEELEKKNEELEHPKDTGEDTKEEMEEIEEEMKKSQEEMQQNENQKAAKSQKKAAQKMKDMANSMQMQMQSQEMEQMEEDMESLRQLMENLIGLSFDQEGLMNDITLSNVNTPRYVDLVKEQYKLKDDFKLIQDSLQALSKRVVQIESFITEKVTDIKVNIKDGLKNLEEHNERKKNDASVNQQQTMKNVNDLALMLSEVMEQMQQQMSSMMSGSQMCNKPGGKGSSGKKPSDKLSDGQQGLNEQMKQMKKAMQEGKGNSSKDFAKAAQKQAALRNALRELQKEKKQGGQGKAAQELQDIIDQMNKVETDLVNKQLTNEMLKRQQQIQTRLLEAEKAERQREFDQKRKAEVATQKDRKMPPSLEEYIKKREAEIEMYKQVSPALKPYYKYLVEEYFKSLKKQ
ncbi:MAG: hypothetical protein ACI8P3_000798 [Saprospiraceae bacterium]|jgi:hypothetical protein